MRTSSSAPPLTTGQRAEVEVEAIGAQADAVGELAHLGLGRVAAGRLELLLRGAEALDVLGRRVLLQRDPQLLEPARSVVEPAAREHVGEDGGVVGDGVAAGILREVAGERRPARTMPDRGRSAPPSTRRSVVLPGAVAADQPDLLARAHLQGRAVDDPLPADLDHQATNGQHGNNSRNSRAGSIILARAARRSAAPSLDRCRCRPTSSHRRSPRWRGRIHLVAFLVSIPAGLALVLLSQGVVGPRRRRHLRGVPRRPLRRQRDLPHRQLGAARAGPAPAHGPRDDLRAHRRLLHPDHAARPAAGVGHLAAGDRVDGGRDRRHPGPGPLRRPAPRRRLPLHRDGLDRRDRAACGRHVARARRSSRSCSPAVCSTPWARSGCGSSGRTRARWCSGTTRCGTR